MCCLVRHGLSPALVELGVEAESPILISRGAKRYSRAHVVFELDSRVLRLSNICGERDKEVAGYALLNGNTSPGVLLISSQFWIDCEL